VAFCSDSSIGDNKWNIYLFSIQNRTITQITFDAVRSLYPVWSFKSNAIVFFSRRDTQGQDDEIYWLHLNRMTPKRLTHEPYNNFCPSWDSKRRFLIYAKSMEGDLRPELFLLNLKNLKQHRLTFNKDGDTEPNISPDGKQLAWSAFRNGNFEIVISNINAMAGNGQ